MNPLQTNPELFANGKFQIQYGDTEKHQATFDAGWLEEIVKEPISKDYYTLIARPIESLTDEELLKLCELTEEQLTDRHREDVIDVLRQKANEHRFDQIQFMDLLGFGILPFPQKLFGDTVIDTRTLTNA